jgi:F-box domain
VNEDAGSPEETQNITLHEILREGERAFPALPRLDRVPLEILAEILSYVNSPQDVLSVARCNKHLRATLLNLYNEVIWRRARRHCIVPGIPDPLPGWSESVYAAFIFGAGNCFVRYETAPQLRR